MNISIDAEKACDKIQYLSWQKLSTKHVEGTYLNTVKAIYDTPPVNTFSSERLKAFPLKNRQGYPLLPLLNIVLEFLSRAVRKENNSELSEKLKNSCVKNNKMCKNKHKPPRWKTYTQKAVRHRGKKLKTQTNRFLMFIDWDNEHYLNVQTTENSLQIQCSPTQNSSGIFYINRTIPEFVWYHSSWF